MLHGPGSTRSFRIPCNDRDWHPYKNRYSRRDGEGTPSFSGKSHHSQWESAGLFLVGWYLLPVFRIPGRKSRSMLLSRVNGYRPPLSSDEFAHNVCGCSEPLAEKAETGICTKVEV